MRPILATLVYCVRDGKVLLAQRKKAPFAGYWVAPGGKIEPGEAPWEGAARELREETGLVAPQITLRAIIREASPRPDWQWLIFAYLVEGATGEVISDEREGELRWIDIVTLPDVPIPAADRIFVPEILATGGRLYEARFEYDDALNLVRTSVNRG